MCPLYPERSPTKETSTGLLVDRKLYRSACAPKMLPKLDENEQNKKISFKTLNFYFCSQLIGCIDGTNVWYNIEISSAVFSEVYLSIDYIY